MNVQLPFTRRSLADVIMFVFIRARFILIAIFGHFVTRFLYRFTVALEVFVREGEG